MLQDLVTILGSENVFENEPMQNHTTFKIGGPASYFCTPKDINDLKQILQYLRANKTRYFILGNGSDLLVDDAGYDGVIISLTEHLTTIKKDGLKITAGAGVSLKDLCNFACKESMSGLEFACGIPGSVGGACFMNAGAYDGAIADVLYFITAIDKLGHVIELSVDELNYGYRKSRVKDDGLVVVSAVFKLQSKSTQEIQAKMDDFTSKREEKQPLEFASAGSTFKRPEGYFAGKLISDAGLKGYRYKGAGVSDKHAGFVVNYGDATSGDVHHVIEHVQSEVFKQFKVKLEPEVLFLK